MLLDNFYRILDSSQNEDTYITELLIDKSHALYAGHFPERPVTPGVILMQLFKEETERRIDKKLLLQKASTVKFMAVVDPNSCENLFLETQISEEDGLVKVKGIALQNQTPALKFSAIYRTV